MVQACAASLLEVKNAQLRFQILAEIVAADRSEVELLAGLLRRILASFDNSDKVRSFVKLKHFLDAGASLVLSF